MFTITLCRLCMILYHNLLYVCIVNTHACFLFSLCFLCALSSMCHNTGAAILLLTRSILNCFEKSLCFFVDPQHCCREKKWRPWIRQSNRIQSYSFFLQRFHPPFSNPPRHTRTHTHQRYGHQDFQVRKQTSQGQGRNPFSGETEKYFLMILGFTPILTESLQMPMVCPGESCSTHVLIVLVGGLLRPHGWQCLLLVFSPHWYAR